MFTLFGAWLCGAVAGAAGVDAALPGAVFDCASVIGAASLAAAGLFAAASAMASRNSGASSVMQ